ncbi:MAG TPA: hypothetical protein VHS78_13175 [Candidatus Elarobacter sp.]|jgi:hypothetical protein|nr:hypothetical protein [Candidatus Elarobacter sp.]
MRWSLPLLRNALRQFADAASALYGEAMRRTPLPGDALGAFHAAKAVQDATYLLPEWHGVLAVIEADEQLSSQVGKFVGTIVGGRVISARELGNDFVTQVMYAHLGENEGFRITDAVFDKIYQPIDAFLGSEDIVYDIFVVLMGLKCQSPKIVLDDGVSIELLGNEDIRLTEMRFSLLSVARDQVERGIGEVQLPEHYRYAFRKTLSLPKVSEIPSSSVAATIYNKVDADRRTCLRAIAAATYCKIHSWRTQMVERSWRSRMLSWTFREPLLLARYEVPGATLSLADEATVLRAWRHLTFPKSNNAAVEIVLDRLAGLGSRATDEDQLIDVMIACEAFFTPGKNPEIRFRLAMNAAILAPMTMGAWTQAFVFEFMQKAYDLRSDIVHGEASRKPIRVREQSYDLRTTTYYVAEIVRRAVKYQMDRVEPGGKLLLDWNSTLYFGA